MVKITVIPRIFALPFAEQGSVGDSYQRFVGVMSTFAQAQLARRKGA
jgi:hypothetical protein